MLLPWFIVLLQLIKELFAVKVVPFGLILTAEEELACRPQRSLHPPLKLLKVWAFLFRHPFLREDRLPIHGGETWLVQCLCAWLDFAPFVTRPFRLAFAKLPLEP